MSLVDAVDALEDALVFGRWVLCLPSLDRDRSFSNGSKPSVSSQFAMKFSSATSQAIDFVLFIANHHFFQLYHHNHCASGIAFLYSSHDWISNMRGGLNLIHLTQGTAWAVA